MRITFLLLAIFQRISHLYGAVIDNEILGQPEIECLTHDVAVNFATRQPFQGHVYVKGHYQDQNCHKDFVRNQAPTGFMHMTFDQCGMRRQRMANPRGMSMSTTIVVSFHRTFVTMVDRAYRVDCFYMEADKILTNQIAVSELPTQEMNFDPLPMPLCRYEVLSGGPQGIAVSFARVGDTVYHKWTCEYQQQNMYCMTIHTCTVDDGQESIFELIDTNGCATDKIILDDLKYTEDLLAGTQAMVFKFADKTRVYFTCQIRLTLKQEEPGAVCPRPACGGALGRFRGRREVAVEGQEFDLVASPLLILEVDDLPPPSERSNLGYDSNTLEKDGAYLTEYSRLRETEGVCISQATLGILLAAAAISTLTIAMFAVVCVFRNRAHKKFSYK